MKTTMNRRRAIAAVAALAGVAAGALLTGEDASAGRLVTGKQIADSSLTGKDLRDGTVTTQDISDGSLTLADFAVPDLPALRSEGSGLFDGPPGEKGPTGPAGHPGPVGHTGITGLVRVKATTDIASQAFGTVTTPCPAGTKVIAGGVLVDGMAASVPITVSAPLDGGSGWHSMVRNGTPNAIAAHGWAVCATTP